MKIKLLILICVLMFAVSACDCFGDVITYPDGHPCNEIEMIGDPSCPR